MAQPSRTNQLLEAILARPDPQICLPVPKPRRGAITMVPVVGGNQRVASASEKRRAIWFMPSLLVGNGAVNVRPLADRTDGFEILNTLASLPFLWEDWGTLICSPWYFSCQTAGGNICVVEAMEI